MSTGRVDKLFRMFGVNAKKRMDEVEELTKLTGRYC